MSHSIIYVGLDVHKETVTVAVLPGDARRPMSSPHSSATSAGWRARAPSGSVTRRARSRFLTCHDVEAVPP